MNYNFYGFDLSYNTGYLQNFGYLPPSDIETGNLRSEDQLKDAIRNLQAFARIPVTGDLDERTEQLLRKPRCGMPDMSSSQGRRKRYTIHGQQWHKTNLTWSLQTHLKDLNHGRVRQELSKALDIWAKNSKLTFKEVNSPNADILVYFYRGFHGDGYAFDGRGSILAHAFFPGSGRGGDAHFDEDEVWTLEGDETDGGTSLFAVAAHEFGHSLGLSHSSVSGALMYPWYQGLKKDFTLPDDDVFGIQQIYGARGKLWGNIPQQNPNYGEKPRYPYKPSVTTARPYRPQTRSTTVAPPPTPHPRGDKPDTCDTNYDAISVIRSEVFIFKGKYMWRINDSGLVPGYPVLTERMWRLPSDLTYIDAVYERLDKKIVFFIGRKHYLFDGSKLQPGYPKYLTSLGLPESLDHIDGAMVWGHNSKTYFFSGTMYWRYDEDAQRVELDYPRDMSIWKGVGYYIDDVFQWKDGATYFFKGKGFWKFNDLLMKVTNERQTLSAPFWMGCPAIEHHDRKTIMVDKSFKTHRSGKYKGIYNENTNGYEVDDNDINSDYDIDSNGSSNKSNGLFIVVHFLSLFILIYSNLLY